MVKFVRSTLYDALKAGASDIHMETDAQGLTVKYRIDGVLNQEGGIQGAAQAEQAISRIKVMSELDIAERRIPQDGRFKVLVQSGENKAREVDMRVSIMPSVFGEDAVLRILDRKALSDEAKGLSLDTLGFAPEIKARFRLLAEEPYGMLLVTGPTGSGKTTTLYGIISEINTGQDKIVTIEDPVEYQLPGVLQIPVNDKKGLTFARGLRSILRHDPDKIMVGEIRDAETAQIAVQSALTGHLVLSTVHANNVFDVIGRFTNMQVDAYSFVSAINGILAQRLVRINCVHCTVDDVPDAALVAKSGLTPEQAASFQFKKGQGCGQCHGTGYKGRKAIAELLCFNDEIRELIVTQEPVRKVKEAARANGTRTMREAALDLVQRGETTLQEINRVTSLFNLIGLKSLFFNELCLFIQPQRIILLQLNRPIKHGLKPLLMHKQIIELPLEVGVNADFKQQQAIIQALAQLLTCAQYQKTVVSVVLSNHFARYAIIPWDAALTAEFERQAFMQHCFSLAYGEPAKTWNLCMNLPDFGKNTIASAIAQSFLQDLHGVFSDAGVDLMAVHPHLMLAINQTLSQVKKHHQDSSFWLVAVQSGQLCLAVVERGDWRLVKMLRSIQMYPDKLAR